MHGFVSIGITLVLLANIGQRLDLGQPASALRRTPGAKGKEFACQNLVLAHPQLPAEAHLRPHPVQPQRWLWSLRHLQSLDRLGQCILTERQHVRLGRALVEKHENEGDDLTLRYKNQRLFCVVQLVTRDILVVVFRVVGFVAESGDKCAAMGKLGELLVLDGLVDSCVIGSIGLDPDRPRGLAFVVAAVAALGVWCRGEGSCDTESGLHHRRRNKIAQALRVHGNCGDDASDKDGGQSRKRPS